MDKNDVLTFIDAKVEEREEKRERLYLTDDEIKREEWELIAIDIKPQDKRCGIIEVRLAYVDDIRDIYTIRNSGAIHLNKVYPHFIKRQILARIKEVIDDKPKVKRTTKNNIKPTHITIKRNK